LERRKAALWNDWECKLGQDLPQAFRDQVENMMGGIKDDTDLQDLDASIPDYAVLALCLEQKTPSPRETKEPRAGPNHARTITRYYRQFERRLRILSFIAERVVPFPCLWDSAFDRAGLRVPWAAASSAWNKAYPDDELGAKTLKKYYKRMRREKYLCQVYFYLLAGSKGQALDSYADLAEAAMRWAQSNPVPPKPDAHGAMLSPAAGMFREGVRKLLRLPPEERRRAFDGWLEHRQAKMTRAQLMLLRIVDCVVGKAEGAEPLRSLPGVRWTIGPALLTLAKDTGQRILRDEARGKAYLKAIRRRREELRLPST